MIIYKVTCLETGKIYIGKTVTSLARRKRNHLHVAAAGSNTYFHKALRKYGEENFYWEVIDYCNTPESLIALEKHYISLYKTYGENGYNLTNGGDGCAGHSPSEETRAKLSKWRKGRKTTLETRTKMSVAHMGRPPTTKGKKLTQEHKRKISESLKGHPYYGCGVWSQERKERMSQVHMGNKWFLGHKHTEETRGKMSKARKGNKNSLGYKHSGKTREIMSVAHIGKKHLPATILKMQESQLKRRMQEKNITWGKA